MSAVPLPHDLPHFYTLTAPCAVTVPKVCRDFVRTVLGVSGLAYLADAAALCTSELATNSHLYAGGELSLGLAIDPDRVRIDVRDGSDTLPAPRRPPGHATGGRGLLLVDAMADGCGVTTRPTGKSIWFELLVQRTRT